MPNHFIDDATDGLLICAKEEFLKQGYERASLRTIAANAGVSTYTIYSRFKDKADLFSLVVSPAADKYVSAFAAEMDLFNRTSADIPYDKMTEYMLNRLHVMVDLIYDDFDTFYLLATNTESKEYENFIHRLGNIQIKQTVYYAQAIGNEKMTLNLIPSELLHLTTTAQFSGIFEIVRHNMSKEKALEYFSKLQIFFFSGYKALTELDY